MGVWICRTPSCVPPKCSACVDCLLVCVYPLLLLQVDLADSCVLTLSGAWQGQTGWDGWGVPGSSSGSAVRELVDSAVDRVRWWAEQCDMMQGELLSLRLVLPLSASQTDDVSRGTVISNSTALQSCTHCATLEQQSCCCPCL